MGRQWNPLQDLMSLQERMNRLFEESMTRSKSGGDPPGAAWTPTADVYETEGEFFIKVELPEIDRESLDLRIENNTLQIRGERKLPSGLRQEHFQHIERAYGPFQRSFLLPIGVDQDRIDAAFKDGVLNVVLRKSPEHMPRTIHIETPE